MCGGGIMKGGNVKGGLNGGMVCGGGCNGWLKYWWRCYIENMSRRIEMCKIVFYVMKKIHFI